MAQRAPNGSQRSVLVTDRYASTSEQVAGRKGSDATPRKATPLGRSALSSKPGLAGSPFAALAQCYTDLQLTESPAATKSLVSDYTSKGLTRMSSPAPKGLPDTFSVYDNPAAEAEATKPSALTPVVTPSAFPVHNATPLPPTFNKAFLQSLRGGPPSPSAASSATSSSHGVTLSAKPINHKSVTSSITATPHQPIKSFTRFTTPDSTCTPKSVNHFMSVNGKRGLSRFAALPAPVFDENARETMTPLARSTRKGLSTRRALGEMTNTPLRRKSALKKASTVEASDTVQVATRLEEPVFGADSVELTTLPMPTEAKLGSRLTFSPPGRRSLSPSATPTQTMPLFTLALSSSSTPAPPAYEETRMFPPCLTTLHVPSAYSLPIPTPILTPTTIQQSAKAAPSHGLDSVVSTEFSFGPIPFSLASPGQMLSSSAVTPHLLAAGVPSPAPGVPFPAPGVPSPTPTADSRAAEPLQHPPVTPACTLSARKMDFDTQQEPSEPAASDKFTMTAFFFIHYISWAAFHLALSVMAAVSTAIISLLPELVVPAVLLLELILGSAVPLLLSLGQAYLASPLWAAFKGWAVSASSGTPRASPLTPPPSHMFSGFMLNAQSTSPAHLGHPYAHSSFPTRLTHPNTPLLSGANALKTPIKQAMPGATPGHLLRPCPHTPKMTFQHVSARDDFTSAPHLRTPYSSRPLSSAPAAPRTSSSPLLYSPMHMTPYDTQPAALRTSSSPLLYSPMHMTPYDTQPATPWNVEIPASPIIPRCIFSPFQVHDSLEDSSSPAQDITWGTKAAALLSCIATWILYHIGLPILAMIIDGVILLLAVMYCTLKAVLCYYLPRYALNMVYRLIGMLWAVTAGWAVVIGCAVGGSPCTVVGTHKLHTRTEHEQQLMQGSIAAEQLLRRVEMCKKMGIALPHQAITLPPASTHTSTSQALLYTEEHADVSGAGTSSLFGFLFAMCLVLCLAGVNQPAQVISKPAGGSYRKPSATAQIRTRWLMANHGIVQIRGY